MDNLPCEMLQEILGHLPPRDLFTCRLVNWQWNAFASTLLRSSHCQLNGDNVVLELFLDGKKEEYLIRCADFDPAHSNGRKLEEFTNCFVNCKNFPYPIFAMELVQKVEDPALRKFFKICGPFIKTLYLNLGGGKNIYYTQAQRNPNPNMRVLKELFVNGVLPNVQHLVLYCNSNYFPPHFSPTDCFPGDEKSEVQDQLQRQSQCQVSKSKLKTNIKIKTLSLCGNYWRSYEKSVGFLTAIFNCKSFDSLERLEGPWEGQFCVDDLQFWRKMNKIHLIKQISISFNLFSLSWLFLLEKPELDTFLEQLRLTNVTIYVGFKESRERLENSKDILIKVEKFLNTLFKYCKETLRELELVNWNYLPGLDYKNFEHVRKFRLSEYIKYDDGDHDGEILKLSPAIINHTRKGSSLFPNLHELTYVFGSSMKNQVSTFSVSKMSMLLPSVRHLIIGAFVNDKVPALVAAIHGLSSICPNVGKLTIRNKLSPSEYLMVAPSIYSNFKSLESLHLQITMDLQEKGNFITLDSAFTGYSKEFCRGARRKIRAKNFILKVKQQKLSWTSCTKDNHHSMSLLDLPSFRHLQINLTIENHGYFKLWLTDACQKFMRNSQVQLKQKILKWTIKRISKLLVFYINPQIELTCD